MPDNYKFSMQKLSGLKFFEGNSRTHSDDQIKQICDSIEEFGFTNPVLIDEDKKIIAGHGRVMSARRLAIESVPCVTLSGLTDEQKRAYVITDNQLALNAGWDFDKLKSEIEFLGESDFNLDLLGMDSGFIDGLFDESKDVDVFDEIEDLDVSEILVKFRESTIVDVTNALQGAVRDIDGAELWYNDEQI